MMRRLTLAAALLIGASPVAAQNFVITGATLALGDGSEPIENGTVVIENGKIAKVSTRQGPVPSGYTVIDAKGAWVTPGLFAAMADIGLYDVTAVDESNDSSAGDSRYSAALDIAPVINPEAQHARISRAGGVTRASVSPQAGNAIFAGQGAVIDLGADPDAVVKPRAFQFVELGEHGGYLAGGSRTAAFVELRNALGEAADLASKAGRKEDALLNRPDAKALIPVAEGRQKLYVHVERASDILSVLALKDDFPKLDLVLVGATEGWTVAEQIAASGVPVLAGALRDLPVTFEQLASTQSNIGRMVKAGVKVGMGGYDDTVQARYMPQLAGNLVALSKIPGAAGLSWGQAFATISSIPADIAGQGGTLGVLKPGAVGDLVIWDGDPLELSSAPMRVFIDGVEQPLDNHQTRLRDRYKTPTEGELPKAFDW